MFFFSNSYDRRLIALKQNMAKAKKTVAKNIEKRLIPTLKEVTDDEIDEEEKEEEKRKGAVEDEDEGVANTVTGKIRVR